MTKQEYEEEFKKCAKKGEENAVKAYDLLIKASEEHGWIWAGATHIKYMKEYLKSMDDAPPPN